MSASSSSSTTQPKRKRTLDIEQALQWAFREELPKGRADRPITAPPTQSVQSIEVPHDVVAKRTGKKDTYPTGAFCKIRYTPSAGTVALDRARYAGWWAGLAHVAELVRVMGLATIEITGLSAPRSPWTEESIEDASVPPLPNLLPPRNEALKDRRIAGRRRRVRRNSEVRQIFPLPATSAESA